MGRLRHYTLKVDDLLVKLVYLADLKSLLARPLSDPPLGQDVSVVHHHFIRLR